VRLLIALALAVSVTVAGCGGDGGEPQTLNVGYGWGADVGDTGDSLAFRALERDEGLKVQVRDMGGEAEAIVGLTRGDVQLAQLGYNDALNAIAAGADVRALMASNMAPEFLFVGRPGVEKPADLRGKRVAHSGAGAEGETLLDHTLRKGGLTQSDVKVSAMDDSVARAAALAGNRLDAAMLEVPDYERLRASDPGYRVLSRMTEIQPPVPHNLWIVDREWADQHRDELERIVAGLMDGYASVYTKDGRSAWIEEARRSFLKDEDPALAEKLYAFYKEVRYWPTQDRMVDQSDHDAAVRLFLDGGQIENGVPYGAVWYDLAEGAAS
jgi:ABC-type nitrate/sulfonate/bicarbonate transport system substrate-binding protein